MFHASPWKGPPPWPAQEGRSGPQKRGLKFERQVAQAIAKRFAPHSWHGPWFTFEDPHGRGFCQPDIVFWHDGAIWVIEVKLTDCSQGRTQLAKLYLPVLRHFYGSGVFGLTVSRFLDRASPRDLIVSSLDIAFPRSRLGALPLVHWFGNPSP